MTNALPPAFAAALAAVRRRKGIPDAAADDDAPATNGDAVEERAAEPDRGAQTTLEVSAVEA
ncbi:MAG: hypothetical protein SH850_31075 [Planctomycetaceae bacterium]|nr:hypothetical protein [Planctomycetaceae bacterium]